MSCVHLRKLYQLCRQEGLRLGGTDLIHIVCQQCGIQDACPSMLIEEIESSIGESKPDKSEEVRPAESDSIQQ